MITTYQFKSDNSPILVSMPHNGTLVPEEGREEAGVLRAELPCYHAKITTFIGVLNCLT